MPEMSDSLLSALADGELSAKETKQVVDALVSEEEMHDQWRKYHAVAAVLRNEKPCCLEGNIDWEAEAAKIPDDSNIVYLQETKARSRLYPHRRWLSGVGVAAALVVGVFVLINEGDTEIGDFSEVPIASTTMTPETETSAEMSGVVSIPEISSTSLPLPAEVLRVRDLMLQHQSASLQVNRSGPSTLVNKVSTEQ